MKILITGPLGQDGIILTELLQENHDLYGICRHQTPLEKITEHKKKYDINLITSDLTDFNSVESQIKNIQPNIIINFAGETDVINPWSDVNNTFKQNFIIPYNILETITRHDRDIFFFQSSSSLMYARTNENIINENSKTSPMFPYGISKLSTHNLLNEYREKYGLKGSSGIFFNHESVHRGPKFITKKLSVLINKILNGNHDKIGLFNLNFNRDISHAYDFMRGVKLILENELNDDYIFSSGKSTNMLEFSKNFFTLYNLDFYDYIDYYDNGEYSNDYNLIGDNTKLKSIGWEPKYDINNLITDMVKNEKNYKL
jgi:GDPmannose 4,6-dehydratase